MKAIIEKKVNIIYSTTTGIEVFFTSCLTLIFGFKPSSEAVSSNQEESKYNLFVVKSGEKKEVWVIMSKILVLKIILPMFIVRISAFLGN